MGTSRSGPRNPGSDPETPIGSAQGLAGDATTVEAYRLIPVYRVATPQQRGEAIRLWLDHGFLDESCVAERRSQELVYLARSPQGELAGTSGVSLGRRGPDGRTVYDLRLFIAPGHRIPGLARELTWRTRDLLDADRARRPASGMRLTADNPKLMRPGVRRYLERHGLLFRGTDRHGVERWFVPFDSELGLTAMAPAEPQNVKVAGAMAVPSPCPLPGGEGEPERAPGATLVKPGQGPRSSPETPADALGSTILPQGLP